MANINQSLKTNEKRSTRGAETENKFLHAANLVFWENGFRGSTIAQIVDKSGFSVGSFYHFFTDKEDLLNHAIHDIKEAFDLKLDALDFSIEHNHEISTLLYRLALNGRQFVTKNRGIYRAISEISQNNAAGFGDLLSIAPTTANKFFANLNGYENQFTELPSRSNVEHAIQLVSMCALNTGLGLAPLFPKSSDAYCKLMTRAACGVLGVTPNSDAVKKIVNR